jgi:hypothetical protein
MDKDCPRTILKLPYILKSVDNRVNRWAMPTKDGQLRNFVDNFFSFFNLLLTHGQPGKDFTPWVYALYRVNKRVLTRKIGQFRVTLRDITP